jgi:hypothetical protein
VISQKQKVATKWTAAIVRVSAVRAVPLPRFAEARGTVANETPGTDVRSVWQSSSYRVSSAIISNCGDRVKRDADKFRALLTCDTHSRGRAWRMADDRQRTAEESIQLDVAARAD